jgi:transcriptional regulator with XRE-family HTH domain
VKKKDEPSIKQRFGLAIKQRRSELGISQEELAFRAELHRTYIWLFRS